MFPSPFFIVAMLMGGASDACTMQPPQLQIEKLRQNNAVIAVTTDAERGRSSALLNDGRLMRVVAMGCEHSGMSASIWMESSSSNGTRWTEAAEELAVLVFPDYIHELVTHALREREYAIENTAAGLIARISAPEGLSIDVDVAHLSLGVLVTVTYASQ